MELTRRNFLMNSAAGAASLSIPAIVSSCITPRNSMQGKENSFFKTGDVVLFQGDSITDAGRDKKKEVPNNAAAFGNGYAFIAASSLLRENPGKNLTIHNRGISGNKVFQLAERWQKDCIDLKPNVLSILIGVNDYWHKRNGNYNGTVEVYENDYRKLVQQTRDIFPDIKLVICQPFAVTKTSAVDDSWMAPLSEYQKVVKKIAVEFKAVWVPFQEVFDEAVKYAPPVYWTADGVHPAMPGAQLMAEAWLRSVK